MWIVQLALRRPYTFVIMSLLIVILGVLAIYRMPTDIFPEIDIPVVSVIWTYGGVSPEEMADIITVRSERAFTTQVNDIEHIESHSLQRVQRPDPPTRYLERHPPRAAALRPRLQLHPHPALERPGRELPAPLR